MTRENDSIDVKILRKMADMQNKAVKGEHQRALAHLQSLRSPTGEVPPPLEEAIRYLQTQKDWIGNY